MSNRDWRVGRFKVGEAQEQGIDVNEVITSFGKHLLKERDKFRDNPQLAEERHEKISLTVAQRNTGSAVRWETLGTLPHGIDPITVTTNSHEAATNKMDVRALLEQRLRTQVAEKMISNGIYQQDLEGRRAAMARVLDASIYIADVDLTV